MAGKLWVRQIKRNAILRDAVVDCDTAAWQEALSNACRQMDVQMPLIVPKHERDWASFAQARFLPEHFLESVRFDRLEAEYIDPATHKGASRDARNG